MTFHPLSRHVAVFVLLIGCSLVGCQSTYYSAMEQFGVYKRDLLKKRVTAARDEQKEAGEQFKDALTRLKEMYRFEGGALEKAYRNLQDDYDDCAKKAENVRERIESMETVAEDLFSEWEREIDEISTASLKENSKNQLRNTREKYKSLVTALKSSEKAMKPVLGQFKDYVLALKHTLNAQAIASLKGEAANIQRDLDRLLEQMNASIAKADDFLKTLP